MVWDNSFFHHARMRGGAFLVGQIGREARPYFATAAKGLLIFQYNRSKLLIAYFGPINSNAF
jgi:hypothetical protein